VQRVDHILRIVLDNVRIGQNWYPVVLTTFGRLDTVHAETTRETGDTTENRLERLGQVVGDEVSSVVSGAIVQREMLTYSNTWIIETQESRLLAILVSPQRPMISGSFTMAEIMCVKLSGNTFVSASTMSTIS
jgi:hypothetical protein